MNIAVTELLVAPFMISFCDIVTKSLMTFAQVTKIQMNKSEVAEATQGLKMTKSHL